MPNSLVFCASHHFSALFQTSRSSKKKNWPKKQLNQLIDRYVQDHRQHADGYPRMWVLVADQGYQGILRSFHCLIPIIKRANHDLSLTYLALNRKLSRTRVIVENYFGRLFTLGTLLSQTWEFSEGIYDPFSCRRCTNELPFTVETIAFGRE